VPDNNLVLGDEDFLDQKSQYALAFREIKGIRRRA
jgi:hypothetical protein